MGKPPAVIIIARHGARLDAVDKNWHLTSPTPYDPPLTYGGWNQARALGARIVSLLQAREGTSPDNSTSQPDGGGKEANTDRSNKNSNNIGHGNNHDDDGSSHGINDKHNNNKRGRSRKRKHQIIVHSSPYLRCLQTAVAVSAGISQYHPQDLSESELEQSLESVHSRSENNSGNFKPGGDCLDGQLESGQDRHKTANNNTAATAGTSHNNHHRCLLRVDAFLGEWLNPEYFDHITPPPVSERMVTTAKAALLQQGEAIAGLDNQPFPGYFPGGWGSSSSTPVSPENPDGPGKSVDLPAANASLLLLQHNQSRHRAASCGTPLGHPVQQSTLAHRQSLSRLNTNVGGGSGRGRGHVRSRGYAPPVPGYAVSPSDTIPRGYVAHARDACVEVDYEWDSMCEPHNWGDGAQYGEEWSSMHKRLRNGLQRMVDWYRMNDRPRRQYHGRPLHQCFSHPVNGHYRHTAREGDNHDHERHERHERHEHDDDNNDYTDTALVIVTHGSGCNALIGALTGQPVLIDVGMASLTVAVRKDIIEKPHATDNALNNDHDRLRSSFDLPVAHDYDLKVLASTDHLRPGNDPSKLSSASSSSSISSPSSSSKAPAARPSSASYRRRLGTMTSSSQGHSVTVGGSGGGSGGGLGGSSGSNNNNNGLINGEGIGPGSVTSRPSSSSSLRTSAAFLGGRSSSSSPQSSPGLWGSTSVVGAATNRPKNSASSSTEDLMVPNFSDLQSMSSSTRSSDGSGGGDGVNTSTNRPSSELWSNQLPQRTPSQRGLWGSFPLKPGEGQVRR